MTIKEIANMIADAVDRPVDGLLISRIKRYIILEYNTLIKEQMNKMKRSEAGYRTQYFVTSFTLVDKVLGGTNTLNEKILRTTNKIPTPIILNQPQPFYYVGASDGSNSFMYVEPQEVPYLSSLPHIGKGIRYSYFNGYIYIYNNRLIDQVLIDCAFESLLVNPSDSNAENNDGIYFTDDMEFPAPLAIIQKIVQLIPVKYLQVTDDKDKIPAGHVDNN